MSALDTLADKAQAASERLAREGGIKAKLADELADDAEFLRKLKPELIKRRATGRAPTDERVDGARAPAPEAAETTEPVEPAAERPRRRPARLSKPKRKKASGGGGGGPNPFVVIGAALVLGVVVAKLIDWRGHAHPRW